MLEWAVVDAFGEDVYPRKRPLADGSGFCAIWVEFRTIDLRRHRLEHVTIYAITNLPPGRICHSHLTALIRGH